MTYRYHTYIYTLCVWYLNISINIHDIHITCGPMRAALAKWLLASWLRCHVRTNEAWRVHGSMGALSQRAAKLIHIDLNSLLVPKRFHAPRFAQYRDKSFNEPTSHVHVSLTGICQTATDSIHTINTSFLSLSYVSPQALCVQSKGQPIKKCVSEYWRCSHKAAAHFFRSRGWTIRMFEKKCKRRAVSMDKSCPAVVLGEQKDWCKHRAVSMDKSCPVVVLGTTKR